ncbi:putative RNA-directed DNA polymerase [Tanacetum coccineum]
MTVGGDQVGRFVSKALGCLSLGIFTDILNTHLGHPLVQLCRSIIGLGDHLSMIKGSESKVRTYECECIVALVVSLLGGGVACRERTRGLWQRYTVKGRRNGITAYLDAGIGILLKFDTGMELVLHNVKHVPDMRLNIISTVFLMKMFHIHSGMLLESDSQISDCCKGEERIQVWSDKDFYTIIYDLDVIICANSPKMKDKADVKNKTICFPRTIPQHNDDPIDLDPVPPKYFDAQFGDDIQNDDEQNDEEHGADDVDAQEQPNLNEDIHPSLPCLCPPFFHLGGPQEIIILPHAILQMNEMKSLYENNTFELTKLPKGKRALKNKWVYKLKNAEYTPRPRYKARLVVKGFSQKKGIDFDEIFSPVVKMGSIRVVLGLAASLDLEVEQMDVKTAFVHGDLDKKSIWNNLKVFQVKEGRQLCRLQKSLYGLKQAPRQWYKKFESVIGKQGFRKTFSDHFVPSDPGKKHCEAVKVIFRICERSCFKAIRLEKLWPVYNRG